MPTSRPPTPRTPRHIGPYSPRHPSPLGFPPLAPHMAFQQPSYAWPHTPDRAVQAKGPSNMRMAFPPEARRPPLAGSTQRPKSQPPPPVNQHQHHHVPPPPKTGNVLTAPVPEEDEEDDSPPPSPTLSQASSLSLYSAEAVSKNFPIEQLSEQVEKPKASFCGCFGFFSGKSRAKEARILGPPTLVVQPAPVPQMSQTGGAGGRRRPSPLNL